MNGLDRAYKAARKAIETTYRGSLTMYEHRDVTDEKTKLTTQKEVPVLTKVPCKVSFGTISSAEQTATAASVTQAVKLFCTPEITLKPGCRLSVEQDGISTDYQMSGQPATYPTHQEIMLDLFDRWA